MHSARATFTLAAALLPFALACGSSETSSSSPAARDAGTVTCQVEVPTTSKTASGTDVVESGFTGCTNGKSYAIACDATTCSCTTDDVETAKVQRSAIAFSPSGFPTFASAVAACRWP